MWLWIKSAYDWAKENLLIIGAAIGSLATLIISLLLTRHDKSTEIVLEHNQESNDNRRKHDQVTRELTEKYLEDLSIVREQAKAAGEELSEEQEGVLVERLESFSSADQFFVLLPFRYLNSAVCTKKPLIPSYGFTTDSFFIFTLTC